MYLEAHFRKKYTDPLANIPLDRLSEPNRPHLQEEKFDNSPLKSGEIKDFLRKARAKSSPWINGISHELYKRCSKILALLWKLLQEAHRKKFIAGSWGLADGIPKEKDSKKLDHVVQFFLLIVECKIFFGVIAKRTRFVINRGIQAFCINVWRMSIHQYKRLEFPTFLVVMNIPLCCGTE